jgi:hypothetical protein
MGPLASIVVEGQDCTCAFVAALCCACTSGKGLGVLLLVGLLSMVSLVKGEWQSRVLGMVCSTARPAHAGGPNHVQTPHVQACARKRGVAHTLLYVTTQDRSCRLWSVCSDSGTLA